MDVVDDELGGRLGTARILSRGVKEAPVLRQGFGLTFLYAIIGAAGRVVIPITIQQAIDHGLRDGEVRMGFIASLCAISAAAILTGGLGQALAVRRLGRRSEGALYDLRVRVISPSSASKSLCRLTKRRTFSPSGCNSFKRVISRAMRSSISGAWDRSA